MPAADAPSGLTGATVFFNAGIAAAPVFVAFGCVLVVLMLWWTGLRHDKHARLHGGKLLAQALGLFAVAVVVLDLLAELSIDTALDAVLACLLVFLVWMVFAFFMRRDLLGGSGKGVEI